MPAKYTKKAGFIQFLSACCSILSFFSAAYFIALSISDGYIPPPNFSYIWLAASLIFLYIAIKLNSVSRLYRHGVYIRAGRGKKVARRICAVFCIAGLIVCAAELAVITAPTPRIPSGVPVKYVIILGGGAKPDGEVSQTASVRLTAAAEYLRDRPGTAVITTGGKGPYTPEAESYGMKAFLEACGISPDRIHCETQAMDTIENLIYSATLIADIEGIPEEEAKKQPVLIITSDSHMQRALYLARELGYETVYGLPAPTPPLLRPNVYAREIASMIKLQLRLLIYKTPDKTRRA